MPRKFENEDWEIRLGGVPEYLKSDLSEAFVSKRDRLTLLNPRTMKPFRFGETNNDGSQVFLEYQKNPKNKNSIYNLIFISHENANLIKASTGVEREKVVRKIFYKIKKEKRKSLKKRPNPRTGKDFQYGDMDEQGRYFVRYLWSPQKNNPEYFTERWERSQEAYINHRINVVLGNVKKRVKEKKLNFDVDVQYLRSIFPNDFICPILETKMVWGGDNSDNSPSLDRVVPDKGYVKGNLRWISNIANTLKSDRNFEIIEKIYLDMKKQREERN